MSEKFSNLFWSIHSFDCKINNVLVIGSIFNEAFLTASYSFFSIPVIDMGVQFPPSAFGRGNGKAQKKSHFPQLT